MEGQRVTHRDILVIGASAGGVTALQKLLAALPENFSAIVLIVTHLAPNEGLQSAAAATRAARLQNANARRPGARARNKSRRVQRTRIALISR